MNPFTRQKSRSVARLGETALIAEIRRWLGTATPKAPAGIGDDCAVMSGSPRRQLITVDPVIFGEHFDGKVPADGVGSKLFNRNLSDIAAMGGRPRAAVVALALSADTKLDWLREFYRGLARVAHRLRVPIVGGDIASQPSGITATMTLIGETQERRALHRAGAKAGDHIFVTGRLGGSRLGHHWRFSARVAEGQWLGRRPEVRALTDVSDGLAKDIHSLIPRGCRAALTEEAIPVSRSAIRLARQTGAPPLTHALTDGEDYELLFAVNGATDPAVFATAWSKAFKLRLTRIGEFVRQRRAPVDDELDLLAYDGFEHLR